ncbi:hypothetical protein [Kordia jejudonensis]|uniref:hypothetical protein n=1 Tax=Kordia jejudonensis TaxID=1348245 RepID=UPI000629C850|nr:hypothetical protein [Kordia jejudonensis]
MAGLSTPSTSIENWKALAQGAPIDGIVSLFQKSGNNFALTLNEKMKAAKRLHIYFSLDGSEEIEFFVIPAADDVSTNKSIYSSGIYPLPLSATKTTISGDGELITWINNWCNDTMRDNWLMKVSNAPQVLVIHTDDFTVNDEHLCYLALRPNSNASIPTKNRMDLVIQNTVTNTFINVKLEAATATGIGPSYRDMARPVPPFGQENHASTDETNFGVLSLLGE